MLFIYPAKVEPDTEGRYLVTFRDLPEAATDGATLDEALAEARDCLDSVLMFRIKYGEDIGKMVGDAAKGRHVHVHNLKTKRW